MDSGKSKCSACQACEQVAPLPKLFLIFWFIWIGVALPLSYVSWIDFPKSGLIFYTSLIWGLVLAGGILWVYKNIIGKEFFIDMDSDGVVHTHLKHVLWIPFQSGIFRGPKLEPIIKGRIGGWFRKCEIMNPPGMDWSVVHCWTGEDLHVESRFQPGLQISGDATQVMQYIIDCKSPKEPLQINGALRKRIWEIRECILMLACGIGREKDRGRRSPYAERPRKALEELVKIVDDPNNRPIKEWESIIDQYYPREKAAT